MTVHTAVQLPVQAEYGTGSPGLCENGQESGKTREANNLRHVPKQIIISTHITQLEYRLPTTTVRTISTNKLSRGASTKPGESRGAPGMLSISRVRVPQQYNMDHCFSPASPLSQDNPSTMGFLVVAISLTLDSVPKDSLLITCIYITNASGRHCRRVAGPR